MPRKQSTSKQQSGAAPSPQQFLLKFIEKNFERRQIDEDSFVMFNRFTAILGKQIEKKINLTDVEGFITMIRTIFLNFDFLNKNRSTFSLFIQLLEICMAIFEKAVSLDLSKDICCQLIDMFWPLYDLNKKQQPFPKMQDKFSKITMPKQLTQTEANIPQLILPPIYSEAKHSLLVLQALKKGNVQPPLKSILTAYLNLEGENYIDSLIKLLLKCAEQSDYERFKKIFIVYCCVGDCVTEEAKNMGILINKIMGLKNRLDIMAIVFENLDLSKLFEADYFFYVSACILDCIFSQKYITQKSIQLLKNITKHINIFKHISKVPEQQKIEKLYNNILSVLLRGKLATQQSGRQKRKIKGSELLRQKLQKFDKEQASSIKKFSFIHELANQLNQMQAQMQEDTSKKEQKQENKLQNLKAQQITVICKQIKKLLKSFETNPKISKIIFRIYQEPSNIDQFIQLCNQPASTSPDILQLLLSVYVPLLAESQLLERVGVSVKGERVIVPVQGERVGVSVQGERVMASVQGEKGDKDKQRQGKQKQSNLLKIIKLHVLQYRIQKQKLSDQQILDRYYWPIHQKFLTRTPTNYSFLSLILIQEYLTNIQPLLQKLTKLTLESLHSDRSSSNAPHKKDEYFRLNIILISSVLDMNHNIAIKLSYNRLKNNLNRLNEKFCILDFLGGEVKENKIFGIGPRLHVGSDRGAELDLICNFVTQLFAIIEQNTSTQIQQQGQSQPPKTLSLSSLINLQTTQQNSYYYMLLIQLCNICLQRQPKFKIQSQQISSILRIRKNNKYTLILNLANELIQLLKQSNVSKKSNSILVLHLLLRMEMLLFQKQDAGREGGREAKEAGLSVGEVTHLAGESVMELSDVLIKLLFSIGRNPTFEMLKIINKGFDPKQQNYSYIQSSPIQPTQSKKQKLKQHIKNSSIIKFYSQLNTNPNPNTSTNTNTSTNMQTHNLLIIKTSIKILQKLWQKLEENKIKQYREQVKPIKLLYDSRNWCENQRDRKMIQVYVKLRILVNSSTGIEKQGQNRLTLQQIKQIIKYLQQNYDQVSKQLLSQQPNNPPTQPILCTLFPSPTHLISYLLQKITKSQTESSTQLQITLLILSLLKTLIDNNNQVLQVSRKYIYIKLESSQDFTALVLERVRTSVGLLRQYEQGKRARKLEVGTSEEVGVGDVRVRLCEKEEQKILQQSKQIYLIFSKMLANTNTPSPKLNSQKQHSLVRTVQQILSLDDYSNIFISIYILRELINLAPILKHTLTKQVFQTLTNRFFEFLMVLKQVYEGVKISKYGTISADNTDYIGIGVVINYFIFKYYTSSFNQDYAYELADKNIVTKTQLDTLPLTGELPKKQLLQCQTPQKKSLYRCLKCDLCRQICLNCALVCHKDHPVVFLPISQRTNKLCQCIQQNCKINPMAEKRREKKVAKSKNKQKEVWNNSYYYGKKTGYLGTSAARNYGEEFQERPDMFGVFIEDELDEEDNLNFIARNNPTNSNLIRAANDTFVNTIYRSSNQPQGMINMPPGQSQSRMFGFPAPTIPANVSNLNPSSVPQPYRQPSYIPLSSSNPQGSIISVPPSNIFASDGLNQLQISLGRYNPRNAYEGLPRSELQIENMIYQREQRLRERERRQRQIVREKERQRMRQRQRQHVRNFINQSRYGGISDLAQRFVDRFGQRVEPRHAEEAEDDEDFSKDKFEDEDYEATQQQIKQSQHQKRDKSQKNNIQLYTQTCQQSYLLPIFLQMTSQLCQQNPKSNNQKQPQISYHIKLINPITLNPALVHTTSKMCIAKSFITKLSKNQQYVPPSPCVSRAPLGIFGNFVFVLSGPKVNVHQKQVIVSYLLDKNGTNIVYNPICEQHLQFQPHSLSVGYKNYLVIAGLHQLCLFQYENTGQLMNRNSPLRHTINNDNINKIKLTKFGIFIGLNRQIRLLTHSLQIKAQFKINDALVKEFWVHQTKKGDNTTDSFFLYVTISQGYIFYAEGNNSSSGEVIFSKKLVDNRLNRPVGVFTLQKSIQSCGNLVLNTYKDKNIGHSLSRLSNQSTLTDINYIKLNNQGLDPLSQKYNIMGLSDIVASPNQEPGSPKSIYIVSLYKEDKTYDVLGVHRGILGIIKIKQDLSNNSGNSKYQLQFITGEQQKCEYFEVLHFEDCKHWVVVSLCEDGGLRVTMPFKIGKSVLEKQLQILKEKKSMSGDKQQGDNAGLNKLFKSQQSQKSDEQQHQSLQQRIKNSLNIQAIKQSLSASSPYLQNLQNSDLLRPKQDYTLTLLNSTAENKTKTYEIRNINRKKIITGFSFQQCSDVTLPTRKISRVFDFGLTPEQALYFYAFGAIKVEVRKAQSSEFYRDGRKKGGAFTLEYSEQRLSLQKQPSSVATQVQVYGEIFQTQFKVTNKDLLWPIISPSKTQNPFSLSRAQTVQLYLQNICLLLQSSIQSWNTDIVSAQQSQQFIDCMRAYLISNMSKDTDNSLYTLIKKVTYKILHLLQCSTKSKRPVIDQLHPLRFSTETKIQTYYGLLVKGEITDKDIGCLVEELYGFVAGTSGQVGAVNQLPQVDVLMYYIARFPALLMKLHKRIKNLEAKYAYKLIPLYVFGYRVLHYLGYHLEWLLPALYQLVGKALQSPDSQYPKPPILHRFILYKYLKYSQYIKLQGWLKNIQGIDQHQCVKEVPIAKGNSNSGQGMGGMGGFSDFGMLDYTQLDLQNEQQIMKRIMQMTEREAVRQQQQQQQQMLPQQQNIMQEQPIQQKQTDHLLQSLIEELVKDINYPHSQPNLTNPTNPSNLEVNAQKATVLYVVFKLSLFDFDNKVEGCKDSFLYLMQIIEKNIKHLCQGYQDGIAGQGGNGNSTLMMWLNLFGIICKQCHKDQETLKIYQNIKSIVIDTLSTKFKLESIKKQSVVPNLFARRLKGGRLVTKCHYIYGFISVLQKPCEANFALLTMGCYWLFEEDENYYKKKKYIETIRENQKNGNINKIYETALSNLEVWKEVGNPEWLEAWVEGKRQNWETAIELLTLFYE